MKSLCSPTFINDFEVLSARVEYNELFFSKGTEERGTHFDYSQCPLQADSTPHCKTIKNQYSFDMPKMFKDPYSFDMPKTSNFMAKRIQNFTNPQLQKLVISKALPPGLVLRAGCGI